MVVLRSREVGPPKTNKPQPARRSTPEPATPTQAREPSAARHSPLSPSTARKTTRRITAKPNDKGNVFDNGAERVLSLRSGKRVGKRGEWQNGDSGGDLRLQRKRVFDLIENSKGLVENSCDFKRSVECGVVTEEGQNGEFLSENLRVLRGKFEVEEDLVENRDGLAENCDFRRSEECGVVIEEEVAFEGKGGLTGSLIDNVVEKRTGEGGSVEKGELEENPNDYRGGNLRGKRRCSREEKSKGIMERKQVFDDCVSSRARRSYTRKEKGKGKLVNDDDGDSLVLNVKDKGTGNMIGNVDEKRMEEGGNVEEGGFEEYPDDSRREKRSCSREEKLKKVAKRKEIGNESGSSRGRRQYSRKEKGKGKLVDVDEDDENFVLDDNGEMEIDMKSKAWDLVGSLSENVVLEEGKKGRKVNGGTRMDKFRDIARQNASRFAHFDAQEQEEDHSLPRDEVDVEMPSVEEEEEQTVEDWPGPFSTAMKIIRDRANKVNLLKETSPSKKGKTVAITWVPNNNQGQGNRSKGLIPSLQDLCMRILVNNADAITSLECVPDALKHRLCKLLCDSRCMNSHILGLLVCASPTEIRIKDCSWLTEEDFTKCFVGCDTSSLMVLQLDQCGRCLPDYILLPTLARSPNCLPVLTTLSLSGACRLSDIGLSSLLSSAPALKSLNISRCSLLTTASVETLANSLKSVLRELYIDDCQGIDAMRILPALEKLEHLEVLSVAGLETVCDDFVWEFIVARGHNLKELILTDCVKLSDCSVKIIAEICSGLCTLDLVNLTKLTDSSLGYLANGCRKISTLKLCRNSFSDEAVAAFLESSGEHLKQLSLNNIKKVGHNTALSLARRSRVLQTLDLSWCRNLTDEAVGLIVDSCLSLKVLKLFGCGQITNVFLDGHSNPEVQIIGLKMSPVLEHIPQSPELPLHYSSVTCSM